MCIRDSDYYFTAATDAHNAVNNILAAKGYTVENTDGSSSLSFRNGLPLISNVRSRN